MNAPHASSQCAPRGAAFFPPVASSADENEFCSECVRREERISSYLSSCGTPSKDAKTYGELIDLLKTRGLSVPDAARAEVLLRECHYYRLMAYRFPFVHAEDSDAFVEGTSFEDLWRLYVFDRRLRLATLDAIERVETALRSRWAHVLGLKYGALAYENAEIHSGAPYRKALHGICEAIVASKEPCITHFRNDLTPPERVPIWSVCEILTQGQLFTMINCLNDRAARDEIFDGWGLDAKRMSSFMNVLRNVRNICAHHGRLWNKRLFFEMKFPKHPPKLGESLVRGEKSVYNVLVILVWLVRKIAPQSRWRSRIVALVSEEREFVRDGMGFPRDWRARPIWAASDV